jgi:hypothetical protein
MIRTKGALYEYMKAHPELKLQRCRGVRSSGWWWLRKHNDGSGTIDVHAQAANALVSTGMVKLVTREYFGQHSDYVLARED